VVTEFVAVVPAYEYVLVMPREDAVVVVGVLERLVVGAGELSGAATVPGKLHAAIVVVLIITRVSIGSTTALDADRKINAAGRLARRLTLFLNDSTTIHLHNYPTDTHVNLLNT